VRHWIFATCRDLLLTANRRAMVVFFNDFPTWPETMWMLSLTFASCAGNILGDWGTDWRILWRLTCCISSSNWPRIARNLTLSNDQIEIVPNSKFTNRFTAYEASVLIYYQSLRPSCDRFSQPTNSRVVQMILSTACSLHQINIARSLIWNEVEFPFTLRIISWNNTTPNSAELFTPPGTSLLLFPQKCGIRCPDPLLLRGPLLMTWPELCPTNLTN